MHIVRAMTASSELRKWRGERTQAEMAGLLGITQPQYSRIESGRGLPSAELALTISRRSRGRIPIPAWGDLYGRRGMSGPKRAA